jgi:uncharacterized membrane protein
MDILALIFRWLHIGPAIVLVGGTTFMLFVLLPAAKVLPDDEHLKLRAEVIRRWKLFVHVGVGLFLISGFYNYLVVQRPLHKGDGLYHAFMGIKILMAMGVFALAEIMVGRSKLAEKFRQNAPKYLAINLTLAVAIVLLSGFLKTRIVPEKTISQPVATVDQASASR